jgi:hypothetical protein
MSLRINMKMTSLNNLEKRDSKRVVMSCVLVAAGKSIRNAAVPKAKVRLN